MQYCAGLEFVSGRHTTTRDSTRLGMAPQDAIVTQACTVQNGRKQTSFTVHSTVQLQYLQCAIISASLLHLEVVACVKYLVEYHPFLKAERNELLKDEKQKEQWHNANSIISATLKAVQSTSLLWKKPLPNIYHRQYLKTLPVAWSPMNFDLGTPGRTHHHHFQPMLA